MEMTRRQMLRSLAAAMAAELGSRPACGIGGDPDRSIGPKVILVAVGGIRRAETFSATGLPNIPHLSGELQPNSTFFTCVRNEGVTSHYNTTSSILTGNWQRVDDWGRTPPESPTIFEYARTQLRLPQDDTWFISSNKALTSRIGASSVRGYGPRYGANVVFPKQMLIDAVVNAAAHGRAAHTADRASMAPELAAMLESANFEGLGWSVAGESSNLNDATRAAVTQAIDDLARGTSPVTGDEFTCLVAVEVMRRFAPSLLVMSFSDVEVAHFGSWALHLAGIRTMDALIGELWNEVQQNPRYRGQTTLLVLPEFGRDFDGSPTNGFFNHRFDNDCTRMTWMMCLGVGARAGQVVDRPVRHVDICPTIASLWKLRLPAMQGSPLAEIHL